MDYIDLSELGLPEKEQKILQAAIKTFSEKGYSNATTSEIAKGAGIAEGTIFRYFKTKKDILRGILIIGINMMAGQLVIHSIEKILAEADGKDLRTVLKEIMHDRIKLIDTVYPIFRIIATEALYHEDIREAMYQNVILKALDFMKVFYAKLLQKGVVRENIDPEVILRSIMSNLAIFILQRKLLPDKFPITDVEKELDKMIDVIMFGISASTSEEAPKLI